MQRLSILLAILVGQLGLVAAAPVPTTNSAMLSSAAAILSEAELQIRNAIPAAIAITMPEAQQDGQPQDSRLYGKQATTQKF